MSGGQAEPGSSRWRRVWRRERRDVLTTAAIVAATIALVTLGGERPDTPDRGVAGGGAPVNTQLPAHPDSGTSGGGKPVNTELTEAPDSGTVGGSTPVDTKLYIDPHMLSIAAAREDSRFDPIAETPQAKWFGDWSTSATARGDVGGYLAGAAAANEVPTMVLYRIPQRDCGLFARGGAADEHEYKSWIDGVAAALKGHNETLVVLEPDALPMLGQCDQGDRLSMLSYAVDALSTTGARVYIDAGHENWLRAAEVADRLKMVGVDKVTGFSLNVSNFYTTAGEVRFAENVRSELNKLDIAAPHYLIDVSRNGAGPQTEVCNPPEARLGPAPQLFRGGALDGLLWVKPPGETDGACRGAPAVGFWPPAALSLLGLQ